MQMVSYSLLWQQNMTGKFLAFTTSSKQSDFHLKQLSDHFTLEFCSQFIMKGNFASE